MKYGYLGRHKLKVQKRTNEIYFNILALVIFTLAPIFLYFGTLNDGGVNVNFDGLAGYRVIDYYTSELLSGEFPLWNKYVECGVVMGSFHTIGLYPFAVLFSAIPITAFSFVFHFFHLVLGAFFFYIFLKELGCDRYSAFTVALIYELSTHIGGYRKEHFTIIVGIVYLPVILYFVQKYINSTKMYWLIMSAIAMGFQFLGSHTQIVVYTVLVVGIYVIVNILARKRNIVRFLSHVAVWIVAYIGTMLGQLYLTGMAMVTISKMGGKTQSSVDFLKAWSIHYIKLFMMAFPQLFGEEDLMPYGNIFSSEFDIEIFLGFFVLLIILFGIIKMNKVFEIRLAIGFMIGAFAYASLAHIPYLAEVIAKIPVLNGFRVPARSLFIFIYFAFVILALVLSEVKNTQRFKELLKFMCKEAVICVCIMAFFTMSIIALGTISGDGSHTMSYFFQLKSIFEGAFKVCLFVIALYFLTDHLPLKGNLKKGSYILFCIIVAGITILETSPYSKRSYRNLDGNLTQTPSNIEMELAAQNYKVLDAFSRVGIQATSFVSYNKNVNSKVQGINAYVTYNNMNIYKLLTGNGNLQLNNTDMFYAFPNMEQILVSRNDALSVLGIKYIIDSCDILSKNPIYYDDLNTGEVIYEGMDNKYRLSNNSPIEQNVQLKNNHLYKVEFDLVTEADEPDILNFDIYDLSGYDGIDLVVTGESGRKTLFYYISNTFGAGNSVFRLTTTGQEKQYLVSDIKITELQNPDLRGGTNLIKQKNFVVPTAVEGSLSVMSQSVNLKPNTNYILKFTATFDQQPNLFYADFYATGYDFEEQQRNFILDENKGEYFAVINSAQCPKNVQLRFISNNSSDISLSNIELREADENTPAYELYYNDGATKIYSNKNAKDVLYSTEKVVGIPANADIYSHINEYDLLNVSYITDYSVSQKMFAQSVVIKDIDFKSNSISAIVQSGSNAFINFSENYHFGWRAYVDGKRTKTYMVNEAIMGMEVPAGEHRIEFVFTLPVFYICLSISILTVVSGIVYLCVMINRDKHRKNEDGFETESSY